MLENQTRVSRIDRKLKQQGRDATNHKLVTKEFSIQGLFVDYVLHDTDGTIIAVVEAKKFSRSARDGEHQALEYAEIIADTQGYTPFVFLTNGKDIYFCNAARDQAPREVNTFFTLADMRRLNFLNQTHTPPTQQPIDNDIAGRHYQIAAVKSVVEGIEMGKRSFLLVMATGTGKTRTSMSLIDVMLKTHNAQKILFLTDRKALRDQSFDDGFKVFFESTPKTKIETGKTDDNARLYSATYQTMINYLDHYSSGYFDMIIVDEVHRSIYGEWRQILDHFDCYKVGLTATPVEYVDRNTYKEFDCDEQGPTYNYGLDEAIEENHLVPYKVLMARTQFQIQGIKGRQLPKDIREQLIKEGKDPEDYNFEGTEIGKKIDNKDTNRAIVKEFMEQAYKIEDGLPGKTIIFAMNQAHAEHLQETFEELYPHLNKFSVVITSNVERSDQLLKHFKAYKTEKKYRVAISVDMMDTGIDVPEVINLVFAKKVFSEPKFWQMIGRGTRLCPDVYGPGEDKKDFLIMDFALNFDEDHTFKKPSAQPLTLQQQYFELKIEQLKLFENRGEKKEYTRVQKEIIAMVKSIPRNDEVLAQQSLIDSIVSGAIFDNVAVNPYEQLQKCAPLTRYYDKHSIDELRFLIKIAKLTIVHIQDKDSSTEQNKVASDINALSKNISKVQAQSSVIAEVLHPDYRVDLSLQKIATLEKTFSSLMKYKDSTVPDIIITDIQDSVIERRWIQYGEGKQMYSDKYREVFVQQLEEYAKSSPAIQKILHDEELTSADIAQLERMFASSEYHMTVVNLRRAYGRATASFEQLIKVALGKGTLPGWEDEVHGLFEQYIQEHNFGSMQIKFLQIVKSLIIQKKQISQEDLYSDVFEKSFGMGAWDRLFGEQEKQGLEEFLGRFSL